MLKKFLRISLIDFRNIMVDKGLFCSIWGSMGKFLLFVLLFNWFKYLGEIWMNMININFCINLMWFIRILYIEGSYFFVL